MIRAIIEFLHARLAEDERRARAATTGRWGAQPGEDPRHDTWEVATDDERVAYQGQEGGGVSTEHNALHIARPNPDA